MTQFRRFLIGVLILTIPAFAQAHREVRYIQEFGGKGEKGGRFAENVHIAFDREGGIYVSDTDNFRIQKLDPDGGVQFEIQTSEVGFTLINPTDIAVGKDGTIYVMDWILIPIEGTNDPTIFNYEPCVHRFDATGKFVASYPIQGTGRKVPTIASAVPGLDAEGNYALIIPHGDVERSFLLTVDRNGTIYVLDAGVIHKLDSSGRPLTTYPVSQPKAGQVIMAADMTVGPDGNLYLVDKAANRVLKYGSDGKYQTAFGERGDRAGQFISPFLICTREDGALLVADNAKYKLDTKSDLPRRKQDPFQFGRLPYRVFRTRIRRVQRFTPDGEFKEKTLIRFARENELHTYLKLKAIDFSGNLYFLDTESLKFRKFAPIGRFVPTALKLEAKLGYTLEIHDAEIDNQDDLDADLYSGADFDERLVLNEANTKFTLAYLVNEDLRCSISNTLSYLWMTDKSFYRAREFEDFRGIFNQDDESTQTFWDDRIELDVIVTRDHRPFHYREAKGFLYLNVIRNDYVNAALSLSNNRRFDFRARISDWGGGVYYDLSRAFRLQFEVNHFFGYNTYTYIDETNILYATGFVESDYTLALLTVDGRF
ncbi:MAG: NHL repeat-containing protein [Candidatus Poribacteria bacterium]|nr:NHL repeat-containing protein [Candidatus Poribacteria bacterium]